MPGKGIDAINLDITHNELVKMGSAGADVVILPSLLKHFAKVRLFPRFKGRSRSHWLR